MAIVDIEQTVRNVQRSNEEVDNLVGQLMGILDIMLPPENTKEALSSGANRLARIEDEIRHIGTQNERQIVWLQLIIELLDGPQPQIEEFDTAAARVGENWNRGVDVARRVGDYIEEDRRR